MPLAGRMKLRTFLLIAGSVGVLALGGAGVGLYAVGDAAGDYAAEQREARLEKEQAALEARREREAEARERRRLAREREPQPVLDTPQGVVGATEPAEVAPAADLPSSRPVDAAIMRHLGTDMGTKKRKDVTSGMPYKVNVYQDDGNARANRAKVDLDRDEQWDEKWTWSDGTITRKIAPNDDEDYSVEEVWGEGAWRPR